MPGTGITSKNISYKFFILFLFLSFISNRSFCEINSPTTLFLDSVPYISVVELCESYSVPAEMDNNSLSFIMKNGTDSLIVVNGSGFALSSGKMVNMVLPAKLVRGSLYVPAGMFLPLFSKLANASLKWDDKSNRIIQTGFSYSIRNISFESFSNGTMVKIIMTKPLAPTVEIKENNLLVISIPGGTFKQGSIKNPVEKNLILENKCVQKPGETQISLRLSDDFQEYKLTPNAKKNEFSVSLFKKRPEPVSQIQPEPATAVPVPENTAPISGDNAGDTSLWKIDTVVIDAGHGGEDSGAIGPTGAKEKDIVLAVALELAKLLEEKGDINVILTRDKDVFIPLHQRAEIAASSGGKLFISIHANASKSREANGLEAFFLSAAKTDDAAKVAERENASVKFENNPSYYAALLHDSNLPKDIQDIQLDMASNVFLKESQDICSILVDNVTTVTGQINRGVKQAGFYVMLGTQATMPSLLAEIGFISNPKEEMLLKRVSYRKRLAQAIYDSIIIFKDKHERGILSKD